MDLRLDPELVSFRAEVRDFLREHLTPLLRLGQYRTASVYPEPEISGPWQQALALCRSLWNLTSSTPMN